MKELRKDVKYYELVNHLNIEKDDVVLISSDLTKLAKLKIDGEVFNVQRFLDSFKVKLSEGTIIIPCFTDDLKDGDVFDYTLSKPTTGALSNKTLRDKSFKRSKDPLHSFLIWGRDQEKLISIENESSLGKGSVFDFLYQVNAKFIFIDVSFQDSFTFVHYIEETLNVNYRKPYFLAIKYQNSKKVECFKKVLFYTKKKGVQTDLKFYEKSATEKGVVQRYVYNNSVLKVVSANEIFEYTQQFLSKGGKLYRFSFERVIRQLIKKILGYKEPID
jgi:aminoglycoside 3-N-acetyltransferase